jgi:hypothetical protein
MIPRTYPTTLNTTTGKRQMVVFFLSSISGLQRWKDYIPVAFASTFPGKEGSYNNDGYIAIDNLTSTTGKTAWVDYVPVYLDAAATDVWKVDSDGFIPVGYSGLGGIPYALFANGEQGAWYDPSDLTTLFQDAGGTTPVTAVEQPVSLMLDKSKNLTLGPELVTNGGPFVNTTGWLTVSATPLSVSGGVLTGSTAAAADALIYGAWLGGGSGAQDKYFQITTTITAITGRVRFKIFGSNVVGPWITTPGTYTIRLYQTIPNGNVGLNTDQATTVSISSFSVRQILGNHAYTPSGATASRPVLSARYNLLNATATLATQNVTVTAGSHTLYFTGTGSITLSGTATGSYNAGTHTITTTAGTLTLTASGPVLTADLRRANDGVGLPVYQEVTNSTTYDSGASFPRYLRFDGSDDYMLTNSVNFTGTDKMTVWAGVRKLSDAAAGVIAESSVNSGVNLGSFLVTAPRTTEASYGFRAHGTDVATYAATTYTSPITNVLSCLFDIGGATIAQEIIPRINGVTPTLTSTDSGQAGTGNYGNYPLYIGRRGGTTLPFNGRIYSLIVRGAETSTAQIEAGESYLNTKTRAF